MTAPILHWALPYAVLLSEETAADAPAAPSLHTEQHTQLLEQDKEEEGCVCVSIHHSWEITECVKYVVLLFA